MSPIAAPLILCATLPPTLRAQFQALRGAHAPEAAARAPAHISLFRHLPGPSFDIIARDVRRIARETAKPRMTIAPARANDRAVVFPVKCEALDKLREALCERLGFLVLGAERAPARLHITIASGLAAARVQSVLEALRSDPGNHLFIGPQISVPSMTLYAHIVAGPATGHRYRGAWSPLLTTAFAG